MTAAQLIDKTVKREARRAKVPERYIPNRTEFLWQVYHYEGFEGLVQAVTGNH